MGHQGEMVPVVMQRCDPMFDEKIFGFKRSVDAAEPSIGCNFKLILAAAYAGFHCYMGYIGSYSQMIIRI
jgi:hypothetical protein